MLIWANAGGMSMNPSAPDMKELGG